MLVIEISLPFPQINKVPMLQKQDIFCTFKYFVFLSNICGVGAYVLKEDKMYVQKITLRHIFILILQTTIIISLTYFALRERTTYNYTGFEMTQFSLEYSVYWRLMVLSLSHILISFKYRVENYNILLEINKLLHSITALNETMHLQHVVKFTRNLLLTLTFIYKFCILAY